MPVVKNCAAGDPGVIPRVTVSPAPEQMTIYLQVYNT